jgi:predicted HTH domain antitoxin
MWASLAYKDMSSVHLDLPSGLVSVARLNEGDVSQEAAKLIALELFREDRVSMGRAAELCRTPLEEFVQFAADHAVPLYYGIAELEEDRRTMERLGL